MIGIARAARRPSQALGVHRDAVRLLMTDRPQAQRLGQRLEALGRRVRGRPRRHVEAVLDLGQQRRRGFDAVAADDEPMIAENENVGPAVPQLRVDCPGQRQPWMSVRHEGPGEMVKPLRNQPFRLLPDGERQRPHRVRVDDDLVRQQRVHRRLDRRPQALGIEAGLDGPADRIGNVVGNPVEHRLQSHRHEARAVLRVGEPEAGRLHPQQLLDLDRGVATGRLDLLGIAPQGGRKVGELAQLGRS